jgi:hypothetical protein
MFENYIDFVELAKSVVYPEHVGFIFRYLNLI